MKPKKFKGFEEIKVKDPYMRTYMIETKDGLCRVNVYSNSKNSTLTVSTHLNHPKKGKNQLFRKGLSEQDVLNLMKNPRIHTGKGYRKNV